MHKTLIEGGSFDLIKLFQQVSEESRKEKNAIPPINEMLYWWTRKPLIVSRAVVLTSTLQDIHAVRTLLGISNFKRAFYNIPSSTLFKEVLKKDPSEIKILDPFGGAGNLIFEAKRLGLSCYAQDYNPVAYLLMKSVLEFPSSYGLDLQKILKNMEKL